MWHGQTCYITQIKTKRVGAWPLWIFSMVAQIFNVFKFIFAKSSRRKIFFCWGHTNTLGTFLRRSPPGEILWHQNCQLWGFSSNINCSVDVRFIQNSHEAVVVQAWLLRIAKLCLTSCIALYLCAESKNILSQTFHFTRNSYNISAFMSLEKKISFHK